MKTLVPHYYEKFRCIADKCRHSCCVGWEIDIDKDTLEYYDSEDCPLNEEIRANIDRENNCFTLTEDERCPFLQNNGLCRIISELGEDALCDICYDHPRFRNYMGAYLEMGVGLCCEAACDLIVNEKEPLSLFVLSDDEEDSEPDEREKTIICLQTEIFKTVFDESKSFSLTAVNEKYGKPIKITPREVADILMNCERLDEKWTECIELLKNAKEFTLCGSRQIRNIFSYFIYRYVPKAYESGKAEKYVAFSVLSTLIISAIFEETEKHDIETLKEIARLYSAEIEYSDENTETLLSVC